MIKIKLKSYSDPLEEGRVDDMKKKYPGKDDLVDQFSKAPGNNKYLDWMMKHHEEASPDDIFKAITKFEKYIYQIKNKDINSYSSYNELMDAVYEIIPPKKELEREGTQKIYEDDDFSIYRPTNKEASCKLGIGTKWCIAATKSRNYFQDYAKGGAYHYFLRIKKLPQDNPRSFVAYTFVVTDPNNNNLSALEIYDSEDKAIYRKDVRKAIIDSDSTIDKLQAEDKEFFLHNKMYEDFFKRIPSDTGDEAEEYYEKLKEITSDEYYTGDPEERVASIIYEIFYDNNLGNINSNPPFVRKQIKKLLEINHEYINEYFIKVFKEETSSRPNRIAKAINTNITPEQKSEILRRIEARKKEKEQFHVQKINKLADAIEGPKYKPYFKFFKEKNYTKDQMINVFQDFFVTFKRQDIEDALDIVFERSKMQEVKITNESKLFKFNKDKKMFKLLR